MQPAVLEFDEAVQVPWRPPLAGASGRRSGHLRPVVTPAPKVAASAASGVPVASGVAGASEASVAPGAAAGRPRVGRPTEARRASPARAATPARAASQAPRLRVGPSSRRSASGRPVRLTRRGRLLLVVLSLAAGLAVGALLGSWLGGGGHAALRLAGESSVVVEQGDTLWSIAASVAGDGDVRDVVDRIQHLNHLRGTVLQPGQVLRLP